MNNLKQVAIDKLKSRGIELEDIARIIYNLQQGYNPSIDINYCLGTLNGILDKSEVTYTILTGIALDEGAEKNLFDKELNNAITSDKSLFGIDEILALSIVNVYGSIALTNFGYIDKIKPDIIGEIDALGKESDKCYTFLDDIIAALVAATVSKIAHSK